MAWCVGRATVLCHGHASLVLLVTAESTEQLEGNRFKKNRAIITKYREGPDTQRLEKVLLHPGSVRCQSPVYCVPS